MSFTVEDVITKAQRKLLDIDDDAYYDSTTKQPMLEWVNEAQKAFASSTHCCQSFDAITLNSASLNYITFADLAALNAAVADILFIAKVREDSGYTFLHKAPLSEMKDLPAATTSTPTRWTPFGDAIHFDIRPTTSKNFTVTVFYSYSPAEVTAIADAISVPDKWIDALVRYVEYCARISDRDTGLGNGAYAEYEIMKKNAAEFYLAQMERS